MAPQPAFVIDISDHWERKLESIMAYQSQFVKGREDLDPSFADRLRHEAAFWGQAIGVKYGEPYNCRDPIGMNSFNALV